MFNQCHRLLLNNLFYGVPPKVQTGRLGRQPPNAAIEGAYIGSGPAPTAVLRVPLITIKGRTRPVNLP